MTPAKKLGELCNAGADDCEPGFVCLLERCGENLARCYRHCRDNATCGAGSACTQTIYKTGGAPSDYKVCSPGYWTCDPLAQTGCPSDLFRCYLAGLSGAAICECPGDPKTDRTEGQNCTSIYECAMGLGCIGIGEGSSGKCRKLCKTTADCPSCVRANGSPVGYCG